MVKWVFSILQNTWKYSVYADNRKLDIKFISNSSNGIYLYGGNGNLLTTKTSNKNEHGIGIKRINEIVKKYNGIIEFDPGTEIFSVSILFPLDNWLEDN